MPFLPVNVFKLDMVTSYQGLLRLLDDSLLLLEELTDELLTLLLEELLELVEMLELLAEILDELFELVEMLDALDTELLELLDTELLDELDSSSSDLARTYIE